MDIQNQRPYKDSELIFPPIELRLGDKIAVEPGVNMIVILGGDILVDLIWIVEKKLTEFKLSDCIILLGILEELLNIQLFEFVDELFKYSHTIIFLQLHCKPLFIISFLKNDSKKRNKK